MIPLLAVVVIFAVLLAYLEHTHRQERRELTSRITHPHVLPSQAKQFDDGPNFVPFDDDDAFHDAEREALNR